MTAVRTPLRKTPAHLLPNRPEKAACGACSATGADVALVARDGKLVHRCRSCDGRERAPQIRADLEAMWPQLAEDHWYGRYRADLGREVDNDLVFSTLTLHRPDVSPHKRWALFQDLQDAVTLRREVAEGHYSPRDLGMDTDEQAEEWAQGRVDEAVEALIGGDR